MYPRTGKTNTLEWRYIVWMLYYDELERTHLNDADPAKVVLLRTGKNKLI